RRLYGSLELSLRTSPLLAVQVALVQLGNVTLLAPPVFILLLTPDGLAWPGYLDSAGQVLGWVAFGLSTAAGYWYTVQVLRRAPAQVLIAYVVLLGVMLPCSAHVVMPATWLPYYVWMAAWSFTSVGVLAIGWAGDTLRQAARPLQPPECVRDIFGLLRF